MVEAQHIIKLYTWRWINLILFMAYAFNNSIHWAQCSTIIDSITTYYHVPHAFVEWTSGLYTVCYLLFVAPGLYAMEKFKMRHVMIFAGILSTSGAWIKVFSVEPDRFIFVFIGQFLMASSYTFTFGGSARLISAWFSVDEASRASAFSLFGDQFGSAASFIIPVLMVHKNSNIIVWERSLRRMHLVNAALSTCCLILIIFFFKDKPKNPPSMIQALRPEMKTDTFFQSLRKMLKNQAFLMLLFWSSVCAGLTCTFGSVLGEVIAFNYPDSDDDAGKIGFIITGCSMFASPVFGYFMDRTHKFREVSIMLSAGSFISFLVFTIVLKINIIYVYIVGIFIGIFTASVYVTSIQIGIEISYPVSEDHCSGLMVFLMQVFSIIFLPIYGTVLRNYGDLTVHSIFCVLTFIGSIVAILTPVKLNRHEAEKLGANMELLEFLPNSKPQIVKQYSPTRL